MNIRTAGLTAVMALALAAGGCGRHEKVADIASPDYWLENYRYFKEQRSAIAQVEHTIQAQKHDIETYKADFEDLPRAMWPRDAREDLSAKEFALTGYVRQYNALVAGYNAKASDITRGLADTPVEQKTPYMDSVKVMTQIQFRSY